MAGTGSALHVNVPLTNYAIAWKPPGEQSQWFARDDFFPTVPVTKDSDLIRQVSQGRMLQVYEAAVGADGINSSAPIVEFGVNANLSFKCLPRVLRGVINEYKRRQADDQLQYEKRCVDDPRWALQLYCEQEAMAVLQNQALYGGNVTNLPNDELWDDYGSSESTIYDEIATRLEKIVIETGHKVNRFGMSFPIWRIIKGHPGLVRRPFINQGGLEGSLLTVKLFEQLFEEWMEPGSVRIYKGVKNRAPAPNDDAPMDLELFWGPGVVAAYVEQNVSLEDFSFAKGFMFSGLGGNGDKMTVLERDAPEIMPIGGREIRLVTSSDWKITNKKSGWFWPAVVDKTNAQYNNSAGNSYFAP
jgi:hypothetical protein